MDTFTAFDPSVFLTARYTLLVIERLKLVGKNEAALVEEVPECMITNSEPLYK